MSRRHRDLMLWCAGHDATFAYLPEKPAQWLGKCIHCNRRLSIRDDGKPLGGATLEHIVPRTHGGADHPDNVAIACSRCNGQKGRKLDVLRRDDPRLVAVIETLQGRRRQRLRTPPDDHGCRRLWMLTQRGLEVFE